MTPVYFLSFFFPPWFGPPNTPKSIRQPPIQDGEGYGMKPSASQDSVTYSGHPWLLSAAVIDRREPLHALPPSLLLREQFDFALMDRRLQHHQDSHSMISRRVDRHFYALPLNRAGILFTFSRVRKVRTWQIDGKLTGWSWLDGSMCLFSTSNSQQMSHLLRVCGSSFC